MTNSKEFVQLDKEYIELIGKAYQKLLKKITIIQSWMNDIANDNDNNTRKGVNDEIITLRELLYKNETDLSEITKKLELIDNISSAEFDANWILETIRRKEVLTETQSKNARLFFKFLQEQTDLSVAERSIYLDFVLSVPESLDEFLEQQQKERKLYFEKVMKNQARIFYWVDIVENMFPQRIAENIFNLIINDPKSWPFMGSKNLVIPNLVEYMEKSKGIIIPGWTLNEQKTLVMMYKDANETVPISQEYLFITLMLNKNIILRYLNGSPKERKEIVMGYIPEFYNQSSLSSAGKNWFNLNRIFDEIIEQYKTRNPKDRGIITPLIENQMFAIFYGLVDSLNYTNDPEGKKNPRAFIEKEMNLYIPTFLMFSELLNVYISKTQIDPELIVSETREAMFKLFLEQMNLSKNQSELEKSTMKLFDSILKKDMK